MQMPAMLNLSVVALLVVATSGGSSALRRTPLHSQKLTTWGGARAGEAVQFLQQEQPGAEHAHDLQKGPNYDSKQVNEAAQRDMKEGEEDDREGLADKAVQLKPEYTDKQIQKDWQRGPEYKSKRAQKAAQVAAKQNRAQQRGRDGIVDKASKVGEERMQVEKAAAQKQVEVLEKHEDEIFEEREDDEKEKDSKPAHYLGPIAEWIDDTLGNAGERKPKAAKPGESPFDEKQVQKDWQHGPKYKSKRAQKAAQPDLKEASDEQKAPYEPHYSRKQAQKDFQRGPNYKSKQVKKAPKKLAVEYSVPEDKEVASVPGCRNFPKGWTDAKGNDCEDYAEGEWCTRHGGYGDAWLDEWGNFEDVTNQGKTAKQVCCVCGGGFRKDAEDGGYDRDEPKHVMTAEERQTALAKGALQSQGYSGELVGPHEDRVTMTSDWGREFGPGAGHRDIKTICAANPENEWCELHGYYDKERPKSSSSPMRMMAVFVALLFACSH